MTNIIAVFLKQLKETFKNKVILIQLLIYPVITFVMENTIVDDDMPEHFFVKMFSVMFVCMAPLTCMSSIISEEKEKNTLRALLMSNVKPIEYLVGIGSYVWLMCMIGAAAFAVCGNYSGIQLVLFVIFMAVGILMSLLSGAIIGICCKNQMSASSVSVPVMMIFSFLPMISMFNETVKNIAQFVYSQQISILINNIGVADIEFKSIAVIAVSFIIEVVLFCFAFKKKGLE